MRRETVDRQEPRRPSVDEPPPVSPPGADDDHGGGGGDGDDLVRVAGGRHQAEAEFIQNLLREEGIPSLIRRSRGFDVPDLLAAGPRDVLVRRRELASAQETLLNAELLATGTTAVDSPARILAGLLIALAVVALIVALGALLR